MTRSSFHYDPAQYQARVSRIAARVVPHETAVPTISADGPSAKPGASTSAKMVEDIDGLTRLDAAGRR